MSTMMVQKHRVFYKRFVLLFLLATVWLVPVSTSAQTDSQQGGSGTFIPCSGTSCSACDLVALANSIIDWLIGFLAIVFVVIFIVAGIRLVISGGNPGAKEAAKSALTNALIGFIIVLGAWLLIDTLMRALVGDDGNLGSTPWSQIECMAQETPTAVQYRVDVLDFERAGGDHGSVAVAGAGSNCPATPRDQVVQVPSSMVKGEAEYLTPETLERFTQLHNAAKSDGVTILLTDGWRSEEEQVILYNRYKGKSAVATPCSLGGSGSNHNSGVAVDLDIGCSKTDSSCNSRAYNWMKENGGRYGFNNALPRDTVHWSPTGR